MKLISACLMVASRLTVILFKYGLEGTSVQSFKAYIFHLFHVEMNLLSYSPLLMTTSDLIIVAAELRIASDYNRGGGDLLPWRQPLVRTD